MNALVKANNKTMLAAFGSGDPFAAAADDMGGSNGIYLKFNGNSGEFTFGKEAEELPLGSELVANMQSFKRGWICWKDEAVVEEIMVKVVDGVPPREDQLPDHGPYVVKQDQNDGWAQQASVEFKDPATGDVYIYKASSKSAMRGLGTLLNDFGKVYKNHEGEVPVIALGNSSFVVKKYGKKFGPKFSIVKWENEEELASATGDNAEDYESDSAEDSAEVEAAAPAVEKASAPKPTAATVAAEKTAAPAGAGPRRRGF